MSLHIIPSAFPIDPNEVGGLPTALNVTREQGILEGREVVLLAPDTLPGTRDGFRVESAEPLEAGAPDRWDAWFGAGYCQTFFPEAFTRPVLSNEAVADVYRSNEKTQVSTGSTEHLFRHVENHLDGLALDAFSRRFRPAIEKNAAPETSVNYQSFFFDRTLRSLSDFLRTAGAFQTMHIHEGVPTSLTKHAFGRQFLKNACEADAIFFHNDTFLDRFRTQAEQLGLTPPKLRRFDLGVETKLIERGLATVNASNFERSIPDFERMTERQQRLIRETFAAQAAGDKHVFFCLDRIDPVKGVHVLYHAIDQFLEARTARGEVIADLKSQYRFFFLQKPCLMGEDNPAHLTRNYVAYANQQLLKLEQKYPGVVMYAEPIAGAQRIVLPALLNGSTTVSATISEGLNLAGMEAAVANFYGGGSGTTILASGAGFSMRLHEISLGHLIETPQSGSVESMREALERTDHQQRTYPAARRDMNCELVERHILRRSASLVVAREDLA